jgi:hypothetical protein
VTYNPVTARKKRYTLQSKLETISQDLLTMRAKVKAQAPHWRKANIIQERYLRLCNDDDLVAARPIRHWTDSKIRCHLFSCVVVLTYLRRLEPKLSAVGIQRTAEDVMDDMRHPHSVLTLSKGSRKLNRRLETPSKTQAAVLSGFGYYVDDSGVLQIIER